MRPCPCFALPLLSAFRPLQSGVFTKSGKRTGERNETTPGLVEKTAGSSPNQSDRLIAPAGRRDEAILNHCRTLSFRESPGAASALFAAALVYTVLFADGHQQPRGPLATGTATWQLAAVAAALGQPSRL